MYSGESAIQIIKQDELLGGILKPGTEIVIDKEKTVAALLASSLGASTTAPIALNVLKQMFPEQFNRAN